MPKNVQLTELEFNKLVRLSQNVALVEKDIETVFTQVKAKLAEAQMSRDVYFDSLAKKYPDLDKTMAYTPVEDTLELKPNVKEG